MATIEKRYLPPLNSPLITESDRSKVYELVGKELADILTGSKSYYPDGLQKGSRTLASDPMDFIASMESLRERVNDPLGILGNAIDVFKARA